MMLLMAKMCDIKKMGRNRSDGLTKSKLQAFMQQQTEVSFSPSLVSMVPMWSLLWTETVSSLECLQPMKEIQC